MTQKKNGFIVTKISQSCLMLGFIINMRRDLLTRIRLHSVSSEMALIELNGFL